MRRKLILTVAYIVAILPLMVVCVPDKSPSPPPPPPEIPQIAGECQYGTIEQFGRKVSISGDTWDAIGEIRSNGRTMFLLWTLKSSGRPAPSVYKFPDGKITGLWGYGEDAIVDDEGELHGRNLQSDTIHRKEP